MGVEDGDTHTHIFTLTHTYIHTPWRGKGTKERGEGQEKE